MDEARLQIPPGRATSPTLTVESVAQPVRRRHGKSGRRRFRRGYRVRGQEGSHAEMPTDSI